ncbi:MAG: hypothetical protein M3N43_06645, partial [Actinomycetota bacterium]|nr:hypothetical protein [Actinomycetota bacterium]
PAGTSGFYSRGDRIQFVNCTVTGAPTAGFRPWDVLWDGKVYGRGQQVKAGTSTSHAEGGVVSQADDLKVYSDFTASPAPRVKEIDGGWAASGSNVAPSGFREHVWVSPASTY